MNLERRGRSWRARVYVNGTRDSATFPTKAQAVAWAHQREAELAGERLPDHSLGEAFDRYAEEVAPSHRGERWEVLRLGLLKRDRIARVRLPSLKPSDIADWKQRRLAEVAPASVRREMTLIRQVLGVARREWGWLRDDPSADVAKPAAPPSRRRRVSAEEVDRVTLALGYDGGEPENLSQRVALAFLFALETAMRSGEIVGLQWADVGPLSVRLPKTKNGDQREVPLSTRAREILALLPQCDGPVFGLNSAQRDALFRKARDAAQVENLTFHDSRAEAIWRLSKKLDVMELARVIGHRDLRSLMVYYATSADELAAKLG